MSLVRLTEHISNRFIYFSAYLNLHPFPDILTDRSGQGENEMEAVRKFVKEYTQPGGNGATLRSPEFYDDKIRLYRKSMGDDRWLIKYKSAARGCTI